MEPIGSFESGGAIWPDASRDEETSYPSLITALCERDAYTRGHCDRVCALTLAVGAAAGVVGASLQALRIASQLHDIGKIGIRDDVLLKPGKLTTEEWEEMKTHSALGERIIRETFLSNRDEVASIVRHHHEAFDGSGYPDGLAREQIPLPCRVLLVVDAYDAMTTGRPYHKARSHQEAIEILRGEVGSKIDPVVFAHFLDVVAEAG